MRNVAALLVPYPASSFLCLQIYKNSYIFHNNPFDSLSPIQSFYITYNHCENTAEAKFIVPDACGDIVNSGI
jgi:hypothetical protein